MKPRPLQLSAVTREERSDVIHRVREAITTTPTLRSWSPTRQAEHF